MATGIRLPTITTTLFLVRSPSIKERDTFPKRQYKTKTHFPFYCSFTVAISLVLLFGAMKV